MSFPYYAILNSQLGSRKTGKYKPTGKYKTLKDKLQSNALKVWNKITYKHPTVFHKKRVFFGRLFYLIKYWLGLIFPNFFCVIFA